MQHLKPRLMVVVLLFVAVLGISTFWLQDQYLLLGILLVLISTVPFFIRFEAGKQNAREMVLISMLAAIAAAGRVLFAALPNVKPTSFVVIMTGLAFGPEAGFMVGAVAAIVSNMFFGQGPWTPWQMFSWGLMGLTAGLLQKKSRLEKRLGLMAFGLVWGFIFGWIMDVWYVIGFIHPLTWETVLGGFAASFYFDLVHGLSNAFFLGLLSNSWLKVLQRIKLKYGLLER
ncbi:MAG: ECF transporter S component [Clostridiales bacterium]|jgi:energy-coupling factor transport system substrate-specific component|nr:ECF transporter S component [Eubacteriales bacterium]MDH7566216.1 ECF transporter S component [Clostridiales bacterium]